MTPYEVGSAQLEALALAFAQADRNEATTRLQIIDSLLFDVLGWRRDECVVEEPLAGDFTDYSLGAPATRMIVEAKREGNYFTLPSGKGAFVVSMKVLMRSSRGLEEAVKQAVSYCTSRGVRLGAVTNGHQLVAFLGSREDGTPPMAGRALVFRSLDEMVENYVELWNAISDDGVANGNLARLLRTTPQAPAPEKLSQLIVQYPGLKRRNEMEIELDILGELFLQDLVRAKELEQEFLSACYCGSGALSQYALVSKDILRTRYYETVNRKYQQVEEARGRAGVSRSLMDSMVDTGLSRRPVVLLGDVGVGKTRFIRHLVTVDAKRELETALVLYVDFGVQPALRQDLQQYVAEEFSVQLREQYGLDIYTDSFVRAVYNGEINRFRDGIYGSLRTSSPPDFQRHEIEMLAELTRQREAHLKRSLQHLRGSEQRSTVVFLDNIDQRPDEFQDEVYLIAHSMAESWHLPVFVTLRPTTFYRSKKSGSLSGYQPRVFTISPPRVDEVVLRRLKYASRLVFDEGLPISSQGITVDSETLRDYITVLIESIERNPELAECLDNVSAGNVRRALDLLSSFIGSGHVHTRKILQIYREKGRYLIPLHEFLRAVIYGDHEHYDPTASFVANAFDISTPSGKEHFITPVLLTYLVRQSAGTSADRGFVLLAELTRFLMALGFLESQIQFAVDRCALAGMLETSIDTDSDRPHGSERARVTQAGVYLIDRLLKQFVYVDAVIVDTPVLSADTRSQLGLSNHVDGRLRRARAFVAYLDEQWTTLADLDCGYDWPATSRAVLNDISSVEARLSRSGPRP